MSTVPMCVPADTVFQPSKSLLGSLVAKDLILVIFSSFDVAANWPSSSDDEAPPNNLGYMNLGCKAAAGERGKARVGFVVLLPKS